jgi:chromate transporter
MANFKSEQNSNTKFVSPKVLWKYFFHLGLVGFGGPLAIVAKIQNDFIEKGWATNEEFNTTIPLIKSMPGPVSLQTAAFWGGQLGGFLGALVSAIGLILPAFIMMVALAWGYPFLMKYTLFIKSLKGLQIAALVLVTKSIIDLGKPIYKTRFFLIGFIISIALKSLDLSEPIIILFCGFVFYFISTYTKQKSNHKISGWFNWSQSGLAGVTSTAYSITNAVNLDLSSFAFWGTFTVIMISAGALVFGTGLAILPFLQTEIVDKSHWISQKEFMDALAFAQLTPGPILIIVTFLGFRMAGLFGATLATLFIFLPGFIHMTTWFPVLYKKLKTFSWIPLASQGIMGAVIGLLIWGTVKLYLHFSSLELTLSVLFLLINLKWKLPSFYTFLMAAVTTWIILS